jgi:hypothetical protein
MGWVAVQMMVGLDKRTVLEAVARKASRSAERLLRERNELEIARQKARAGLAGRTKRN